MENNLRKYFERTVPVNYTDTDCGKVLKPSVLLNFLQDLASDNAENLGFGYTATMVKQNLGWFLLKYRMEFEDYPSNIGELFIKTDIRGYHKFFTYRDFSVYSKDKLLGRMSTTWSLVDLANKKMVLPAEHLDTPYLVPFEKRDDDLVYGKIKTLSEINSEREFYVRFDDLDVNGHVNNSIYIVWAFEALDYNYRIGKKPKKIDMVFKKEIKYGTKVLSQASIGDTITNHVLKNSETGEDFCSVLCEWQDR